MIASKGSSAVLEVHRTNLIGHYNSCMSLQENFIRKLEATEAGAEEIAKAQQWSQKVTATHERVINSITAFLARHEEEDDPTATDPNRIESTASKNQGVQNNNEDHQLHHPTGLNSTALEAPADEETVRRKIEEIQRTRDEMLEDSRIAEERRVEDIKRAAAREEKKLLESVGATANVSISLSVASQSNAEKGRKRNHATMESPTSPPTNRVQEVDAWIFEPFSTTAPASSTDAFIMVSLMSKLDVEMFDGSPRNWPLFIQSFKHMVHDVVSSDASRLTMLKKMLVPRLREGMSQILSRPGSYQKALQELRANHGLPHLVVMDYIDQLRGIRPVRDGDAVALESFQSKLHGAVETLEAAGYEHELRSSVALEDLIEKLPAPIADRWGRYVTKLVTSANSTSPTLQHLDSWLKTEVLSKRFTRRPVTPRATPSKATTFGPSSSSSSAGTNSTRKVLQQPTTNTSRSTASPTVLSIGEGSKDGEAEQSNGACRICNSTIGHPIARCNEFVALTPTGRARAVKDLGNCFRCLGRNHRTRDCKKTNIVCACKGPHHPMLCGAEIPYATQQGKS